MQEGHPVPPGAGAGFTIDEFVPLGLEAAQFGRQVRDAPRHVVEAGPPLLEEAGHAGVGAAGLDELHLAEEGHVDPLVGEFLHRGTGGTAHAFEERTRGGDGRHHHADVVEGAS
jgi:hypothetical protein